MTAISNIIKSGLWVSLLVIFCVSAATGYPNDKIQRDSAAKLSASTSDSVTHHKKFVDSLASLREYFKKNGYEITPLLKDPRFEIYEGIDERFKRSAEAKSIDIEEYKRILNFDEKQRKIIDFMNTHAEQLEAAEQTYGIPKFVISAIIGIESSFGENFGSYNPFNSYVSMYAVGYRKKFARAQLKELLIFAERNNIDVLGLKSSYAGAMSFAQFIPYSLNKWFVGDDIYDINNNILSVANYLAYFKERTGSLEKAVLRYNPSSLYTEAVLDLAKDTETRLSSR